MEILTVKELKAAAINFVGMVLMVGGVAAMVAIVYAAHALANSQRLVNALVSTGHFVDVRAAQVEAAEAVTLEKYNCEVD